MWVIYALLSALTFSFEDIITYYFSYKEKILPAALNSVYHIYVVIISLALLALVYIFKTDYAIGFLTSIKYLINNYLLLAIFASIFAMIGNILLYQSYQIGEKHNPSIMTGISNCSVILTTLLCVLYYQIYIDKKQFLGIVILLISFFMLSRQHHPFTNKKKKRVNFNNQQTPSGKKNKGVIYALGSAVAYGLHSFCNYIIAHENKKIKVTSIVLVIALVQSIIGIGLYYFYKIKYFDKYNFEVFNDYDKYIDRLNSKKYTPYLICGGLLQAAGLFGLILADQKAPSPGIADAVDGTYLIPLAILSYLIFGSKMDKIQILGIIFATIGTILVSL